MSVRRRFHKPPVSKLFFERLESRLALSSDCLFDLPSDEAESRAAMAINCFGLDLYEHLQHEEGNLFVSPLSIATALTMTYLGASGETSAEMEEVLHLGAEPGIHSSFGALLSSLGAGGTPGTELVVANAIWPQAGMMVREAFVQTIETEYDGEVQTLDYSSPDQAADVINSWVAEKTHGRVQDLIDHLDPATRMVLTNSMYIKARWANPFDASYTNRWVEPQFQLDDGRIVENSMMYTQIEVPRTMLAGFDVLEMPFEGGEMSMVFLLPEEGKGAGQLTGEVLVNVHNWLETPRDAELLEVVLPKFQLTVSTELEKLLFDMGMPRAFGHSADFSSMTDAPLFIDTVRHKTFLETTEQGIEAGAATSVEMLLCFAAGTPILTPDGEKPIEHVKAGDYVLSRDEYNVHASIEPKRVERTFRGEAELIQVKVGGQFIRVTQQHRFFVKDQGWKAAGELQIGDLLATDLCSWRVVEGVSATGEVEPVYNLRVADHHTYFVGSASWGFAVWTHNLYGTGFYANRPFHFLIRDNTSSTFLFLGRIDDPTQSENRLVPTIQRIAGDSNDDGHFNSADLVQVLEAGEYEDEIEDNSTWEEGDWNRDGDFNTADLVQALQEGHYELEPEPNLREVAAAVDWICNSDDAKVRSRAFVA